MIRALSLLSLVALSLTLSPAEELRFAPRQDLAVRTTFQRTGRLELETLEMTVDGASHGGMGKPELSLELTSEQVFLDRYEQVDEGRVTRLARTYETLSDVQVQSISGEGGSEETTLDKESDLEGRTVVFTWDEDDGEYGASFQDDEGDSALLEGLQARIDLAAFLPEGEAAEGDEWEVPAEAFRALIDPGGDLHLKAEEEPPGGPSTDLAGDLDGTIRATLRGEREEGGVRVVVIALDVEVTSTAEQQLEESEGEASQVDELDLEGELLWDPAAGHLRSLELSGEVRARVETRREVEMGDQTFEVRQTTELAGDVSYHVTVEEQ